MKKIAIIGGGFAGLSALLTLKKSKQELDIKLFDRDTHFEYTPGLHEGLYDEHRLERMKIDLRKKWGNHFIHDTVLHIDKKIVKTTKKTYSFDYIIITTGSRTNFFGNKSFEKYGFPLRRISDVHRINKAMHTAKHIVVVGGGYTGVEVASVIAQDSSKKVTLIHSQKKVLDRLGESVSRIAKEFMELQGVELILGERVEHLSKTALRLSSGKTIKSDLVILSGGIKANDEIYKEQAVVDEHFHSVEDDHILMAGDAVRTSLIPTAHNAMLEGRHAARCLLEKISDQKPSKIKHASWSLLLVALGTHDGIFVFNNKGYRFPFTGFLKWLVEKRTLFEFKTGIMLPL